MLARYGGEEFGLLIADCTLADAYEVVERMRRRVPSGITCSAGLAMRHRGETAEALIARADAALYRAKSQGRDRTIDAESGEAVGVGSGNARSRADASGVERTPR